MLIDLFDLCSLRNKFTFRLPTQPNSIDESESALNFGNAFKAG